MSTPERPTCTLPECDLPAARGTGSKKWYKCCCAEHARIVALRAYSAKYTKIDIPTLRTVAAWGFYRSQLAQVFGVSTASICDAINRHGIQVPFVYGHVPAGLPSAKWAEKDPALFRHYEDGLPLSEIGRRIGETTGAVAGRLYRQQMLNRKPPKARQRIEFPGAGCCVYPHGNPPEMTFCGERAVEGKPYCYAHAARCYKPGSSQVDMAA